MLSKKAISRLIEMLSPQHVLFEKEDLLTLAYDATPEIQHLPDVIVFPTSSEQVIKLVKFALEEGLPIVPRGSGTGLSGGSIAANGGMVLCMTRMNRILEISEDFHYAVVEPGVTQRQLLDAIAEQRLALMLNVTGSTSDTSLIGNAMDRGVGYFDSRARGVRFGLGSINQERNSAVQKSGSQLNMTNGYWDANMNRVQISSVQQVGDRAFFRQGNRWTDSRIVDKENQSEPSRVVEFGSKEFMDLAQRLASENRQGSIMMRGEVMLVVDGKRILVRNN